MSDKENAFNRLIALFICKLVDEIKKTDNDEVEFQYKIGTDTYESLQDRLQKLHCDGMQEFMKEKIHYVPNDYAENVIYQYTGQNRKELIADLNYHFRILKFYTNNDFAFKDVHNEELFQQNGKLLVEVVQLFEKYRIIGSRDLQMLGDLFEQLLNKGFKQNEGQFFTPVPITRFIWDSLPLERIMKDERGINYPKVIDYACGAGHFLTEGFKAVNAYATAIEEGKNGSQDWVEHKLYGIEKDYRLARVSKISLFMHGAGTGNIVFGDGLENYGEKGIVPESFDVLVANPPYAVSAFKPHLNLKENSLCILDKISNTGSEIETLFVERIAQLLKPKGVAAVILPSSILNKENESFIAARESLLCNFYIRAVVQFGSKTFGATGTNTVVMFLEKYNEPPKRYKIVADAVNAILENRNLSLWEDRDILNAYLAKIDVKETDYEKFICRNNRYGIWQEHKYFGKYVDSFEHSKIYLDKKKQKTFTKMADTEQQEWLDRVFYQMALRLEKEKLMYFALVYNQSTLIISAPADNKGQEQFLGYNWSNRKGAEGIQVINKGGMLYNDIDRFAKDKLSEMVRAAFDEREYNLPDLQQYYYVVRTQDMLDFSGASFNKVMKTSKFKEFKLQEGMTAYSLTDKIFEIGIGDRVLSSEIVEDGKYPVYSANVRQEFGRINKQNITDFSRASIIWGIDGDWMVNCIPANIPFYPTDHCGFLRIHSDEIVPEYLAILLHLEGKHEGFSRVNRAAIQRIKMLKFQVPDVIEQKRIVQEIQHVDNDIINTQKTIVNLEDKVKDKFNELQKKDWNKHSIEKICEINPSRDIVEFSNEDINVSFIEMASLGQGEIINQEIRKLSDVMKGSYKFFKEKDIIIAKITPCMENGKCSIANNLLNGIGFGSSEYHVFRCGEYILPEYLFYTLNKEEIRKEAALNMTGISGHRRVPEKFYAKMNIAVPPIELQQEFSDFVNEMEAQKAEQKDKLEQLKLQREQIIEKYFN